VDTTTSPGPMCVDRCWQPWLSASWETDQWLSLEYRQPLDRTMVAHCPLSLR